MRIDAHHHLWDLEKVNYPWLMAKGERRFFGDPSRIQRNYLWREFANVRALAGRAEGPPHASYCISSIRCWTSALRSKPFCGFGICFAMRVLFLACATPTKRSWHEGSGSSDRPGGASTGRAAGCFLWPWPASRLRIDIVAISAPRNRAGQRRVARGLGECAYQQPTVL